jgi:uncharacterized phiE125 gp8 family phage protein
MNVITLDQPPEEPVTLTDVYATLRLTPYGSPLSHPHDTMLRRMITTARIQAENHTHRTFVYQRLLLVTDRFPTRGWIELLNPPVIEVRSVGYYDADGVLNTVDTDEYTVTDTRVPRVHFGTAFWAPNVAYHHYFFPELNQPLADTVRIEYIAGYDPVGSPPDYVANVPAPIKDAILVGVQLLYDKLDPRERESMEMQWRKMLEHYVVHAIA